MPIIVSYELTYSLYKQSCWLHRSKSTFAFSRYIFLRWVCPAIAFVFGILAFMTSDNGTATSCLFACGVFAVWWLIGLWVTRREIRRGYRSSFPASLESRVVRTEFDEERVVTSVGDGISSQVAWESFCRVVEDEDFLLLYVNKNRYIPILLSAVEPQDRQSIRTLVYQNVIEGKTC